jgi:hypothetical protein
MLLYMFFTLPMRRIANYGKLLALENFIELIKIYSDYLLTDAKKITFIINLLRKGA